MDKNLKELYALHAIGFGALPLSVENRPPEIKAINVIEKFIQLGGNFIDSADIYGLNAADKGHNEKLIHKALKHLNQTDEVLVSTKGGATRPNDGWGLRGGKPEQLRSACEQSLMNLNIDTHMLYYLHGPDPHVPLLESLGELYQLQREGKINHIGIANVSLTEVQQANSLMPISAVQNRCNPFCKDDLSNGVVDYCQQQKIIYVPYCPLGGLTEHAKLATYHLYAPFIEKYGVSSYEITLAWLLSKAPHVVPIPGMKKIEHVIKNMGVKNIKLDDIDVAMIDKFPELYAPAHIETNN
jgi:aryl-alcohol dehydrogenase-like predicted oxidoreductase